MIMRAFSITTLRGRFVDVNAAFERGYGYFPYFPAAAVSVREGIPPRTNYA
jgi:hypothetical protein